MDQSRQQLAEAFELFNSASEELTRAYRDLERQVNELSDQLATARDERLRELAAKEDVADRLGTIFDLMPAALLVLDASDRVTEANPAAYTLLGHDLVGRPWQEVLDNAGAYADASGDELVLPGTTRATVATASLNQSGGRIVLVQDVSETRRLQARLEQTHRLAAMGEMVAGAAHQLRTPLATALLQVSRLADEHAGADAALRELRRLDQLVHDMLVFARGGDLGAEPVRLEAVIDELRGRFSTAFVERGGRLDLAGPVPSVTVEVNREALVSALGNLINNCLHAVDNGPVLELRPWADSDAVRLDLIDNGPGIRADEHHRIFEPFFTTRADGTGLGLAVTAEVLSQHAGAIESLPAEPSAGAHFRVQLPAVAAELPALTTTSPPHPSTRAPSGIADDGNQEKLR